MKYILSENAGFCFGVKRAINKTDELLKIDKNIYSLGNIIHNTIEIDRLKRNGLKVICDIDEIDKIKCNKLIIRSHGVGIEVYRKANQNNIELEDLTCPFVKKIHNIVEEAYKDNFEIIVFGNYEHPEIQGIRSWARNKAIVIENYEELLKTNIDENKKYIVVFQTTFNKNIAKDIIDYINKKYRNIKIYDTICEATDKRQNSAIDIAKKVDFMIVIGDKESSNSNKLYQLSLEYCKSIFISDVIELKDLDLKKYNILGITAGASTPDYVINDVVEYIKSL